MGDGMDVLFIEIVNRKIVIHTKNGIVTGSVMQQLERLLSSCGYEKVEQSILAKIDEAQYFDNKNMKLWFNNGESCPVSFRNVVKIYAHFDKVRKSQTDL